MYECEISHCHWRNDINWGCAWIFGVTTHRVVGGWRKEHNEEFQMFSFHQILL